MISQERLWVARMHGAVRIGVALLLASSIQAQTNFPERVFPQSKTAVENTLKTMQSTLSGRLPTLDGFARPGEHPLDRYQRGFYQATFQVTSTASGGSLVRVIAGDVGGVIGPGSTQTPIALVHASIAPGAILDLPWDERFNALAYVLAGSGTVGTQGQPMHVGQLAVFGPGDWMSLRAADQQDSRSENLEVLLLGGEPIGEHVEHYGPFVMNTREEIGQAVEDFEAGRLGRIPPNALMPHVPDPAPVRTERSGI